jgi:hypothetical protein
MQLIGWKSEDEKQIKTNEYLISINIDKLSMRRVII